MPRQQTQLLSGTIARGRAVVNGKEVPPAQLRDRVLEMRRVPSTELLDHAGNWRTHPKAQQEALSGVLKQIGIAGALLAYYSARNDGKLTLIDGHLRKQSEAAEWPTLILDVDDAEADVLLATHDPLAALAQADQAKLSDLLQRTMVEDAAVTAMLSHLAKGAGLVDYAVPESLGKAQAEKVVAEVLVEVHCSRANLELFAATLNEWGAIPGVSVNVA